VRVAITGLTNGQNWAIILHAQLTTGSAIVQADLDTWLGVTLNAFKTQFQGLQANTTTAVAGKAVLYAPGGGELISNVSNAWTGTGAQSSVIGSACRVLSWSSGVYWRGGKPRTYLPGVMSSDLNAGTDTIAAAVKTSTTTAAAAFRVSINTNTVGTITGSSFGFISYRSGNANRVPPVFYAITGVVVHSRIGSQRRRDGKWLN
jgi:hypothetical protein